MKNLYKLLFIIGFLFFLGACNEDDKFTVPQSSTVDVAFSFTVTNEGFAPATVQFSDESRLAEGVTASYLWGFGDGTSSNEQNPAHVYTNPGSYNVTFSVTTGDDLDFAEKTITIKDPNALLVRLFLIDAGDMRISEVNGNSFAIDGFGTGIEYDPNTEKVYFTDADAGSLMRVDLDGNNLEMITDVFTDPRDVALDTENNKAYVTDRGAGVHAVYVVDLNDNTASVLYDNASDGLGQLPVGIDYYDGNIYVTCVEIDAEAVWVGPVNGSVITRIIDYGAGGYGYGIAVDKVNEKIYFDDTDTGNILMANLDGSSVQTVIETGNRAYGIVIDNANEKMYYTERNSGSVFMANLDGSSKVTLSSDFNDPRGIFFIP